MGLTEMFDLEESTLNGWYFEKMVNGKGVGTCPECGHKIDVQTFNQLNNLKPHNCKKDNNKNPELLK